MLNYLRNHEIQLYQNAKTHSSASQRSRSFASVAAANTDQNKPTNFL